MNKTVDLMELVKKEIDEGNVPEVYVDYRDRIFLSNYKLDNFSKDCLVDEIYEDFLFDSVDDNCIRSYIDYLLTLKEFEGFTEEDFKDDEIYCLMSENVDYNIEELFNNTSLNAYFFPDQQDNLNSEGRQLWSNIADVFEDEEDRDNEPISPILTELFSSQGYKLEDLRNDSLVENSKFLKSFIEELKNLSSDRCMLTVLTRMNLNEFFDVYNTGKNITVGESTTLGLYDAVCGGGSCLEIELEKPFSFEVKKDYFEEFNFSGDLINYGYDIDEVYGLIGECWSEKFEVA
ncbi:MAG: hypothetical protein E6053_08755 [Finegoldia magna]|uniref:hypothetical protein n=1 Tax=Finegoldia magna TaxID=1260 RepID=UPI002914C3DD|nr:hypothetical protein [Finegoldia magna]MDU5527540.1 hypothetical protein [Finegoldia magna]